MTLGEASERFCISIETLSYYEEKGLIRHETLVDGVPDYTEDEFHKAGIIHALMEAGMDADAVGKYLGLLSKKTESKEEQIRILRKQRNWRHYLLRGTPQHGHFLCTDRSS